VGSTSMYSPVFILVTKVVFPLPSSPRSKHLGGGVASSLAVEEEEVETMVPRVWRQLQLSEEEIQVLHIPVSAPATLWAVFP
jgi:hypothetical protein